MLVTGLFFAAMGPLIRSLAPGISPLESMFFRSVFGATLLLPYIFARRLHPLGSAHRELIMRGAIGGIAAVCYFYCVLNGKLAEMLTIYRSAALIVPFLAYFYMREPLVRWQLVCALVGFSGVCLILKPSHVPLGIGALFALGGALSSALAWTTVRSLSHRENPAIIILYFFMLSACLSFALGYGQFRMPNQHEFLLLLSLAIVGLLGQVCLTLSYRCAPAAVVTPMSYSEIAFSAYFGLLWYNEILDLYSILGVALVFIAGVLVGRRRPDAQPQRQTPDQAPNDIERLTEDLT